MVAKVPRITGRAIYQAELKILPFRGPACLPALWAALFMHALKLSASKRYLPKDTIPGLNILPSAGQPKEQLLRVSTLTKHQRDPSEGEDIDKVPILLEMGSLH